MDLAGVDGASDLVDVSSKDRHLPDRFAKGVQIIFQKVWPLDNPLP